MRAPVVPTVGLNPGQRPGFTGAPVRPASSAAGAQAEQLGAGISGVGQAVFRVGQIMRSRYDRGRANEGAAQLSDEYRKALLGDGADGEEPGFLSTIGRATIDGRDALVEKLGAARERISNGLDNPAQQARFGELAESRYQSAIQRADGHFVGQTRAFDIAGATTLADTLSVDMVEDYFTGGDGEFEKRHDELFGTDGAADTLFGLQGRHPKEAEKKKQDAMDKVYGAVVARIAKQDPVKAEEERKKFLGEGKLSRAQSSALAERIRLASTKHRANALTMDMRTKHPELRDQLNAIDAGVKSKQWTTEIGLEAFDMAVKRARVDDTLRAKSRTEIWNEVTGVLQADGTLTPEQEEALETTGQEQKLNRWIKAGNQHEMSDAGWRQLAVNLGPDLVRDFDSEEEVYDNFIETMSHEYATSMVARWANTKGEQAKAAAKVAGAKRDVSLDEGQLIMETYASAAGIPDKEWDAIPTAKLARWGNAMRAKVRSLMAELKVTEANDFIWREAGRQLAANPVYLSREDAENRVGAQPLSFIGADRAADRDNPLFSRLRDGTVTQYDLQAVMKGGDTTRSRAVKYLVDKLREDTPDKPRGFIKLGDQLVAGGNVHAGHMAEIENTFRMDDESDRRGRGTEWMRAAYHKELQAVMRENVAHHRNERIRLQLNLMPAQSDELSFEENQRREAARWQVLSQRFAPMPEWEEAPIKWAHEEAVNRIFARSAEWKEFYLTDEEVRDDILKWVPPTKAPPDTGIESHPAFR